MFRRSPFFLLLIVSLIRFAFSCPSLCSCRNERLDCSRRGLNTFPHNIPHNIHVIDVSGNNIEIFNVSSLHKKVTSINASDNQIREIDGHLQNFIKLAYLNLRKNFLAVIPTFHPSLERLDLSSNLISNLTEENFITISRIRFVDLSRNKIASIPSLSFSANNQSDLEKLDLTANSIHEIQNNAFQCFPNLISLRLYRNKIQHIDRNTFQGLRNLESLDLARNQIRSIPALAFKIPSLVDLHLAKNRIQNLEDGSFFGCDSLQSLNISHNRLNIVSDGWLFGLGNLQTLDLSINQIPSFDPNIWSQSPNLRFLSMERNMLRSLPSGAFRLIPRLEHLFLGGNYLETLHKTALTALDSLKTLDLSANALAICAEEETIIYNTSMPYLRSLKLSSNQLKVVPSRAFARFPALEKLDLTNNPIATIHAGAFEPLRLKELKLSSSFLLCDCHMSWFAQWFSVSNLNRSQIQLHCSYPKIFRDINMLSIDSANLTCFDDSPRARIVSNPEAVVHLTVGDTARFTCKGTGYPPITTEWKIIENGKSRTLVEDSTTKIIENRKAAVLNDTEHVLVESILELNHVSLQDRAEYQCLISNQFAKGFSLKAQLEVSQAPIFVHEPDDMSLLVGQNAKIMCAATGVPSPILKWSKDGDQSFPAAFERRLHVRPNDDHLYVLNVTLADQGVYTCHVSNDAGSAQASATLRVYQNKFQQPLRDSVLTEKDHLLLDCSADISTSHQRIEWKKNDILIPPTDLRFVWKSDNQILLLPEIEYDDGGSYSCELWAGPHFLDRQQAKIEVVRKKEISKTDIKRRRRWLPNGLMAVFIIGDIN
ncbi:unnamed protein product [Auanema sp. JU1783]|nr:unnamed protein product [Auanema sp. JU1783]